MKRFSTALLLVLTIVLLLSGCVGILGDDGQPTVSDERSATIYENATAQMERAETFRVKTVTTVSRDDRTVTVESDTLVNRSSRRAYREFSTGSGFGMSFEEDNQYLEDETRYVKSEYGWSRRSLSTDFWNQTHGDRSLLDVPPSRATYVRSDTIDREPVYVLDLDVDDATVRESLNGSNGDFFELGDRVENSKVRVMISKSTGYVRRIVVTTDVVDNLVVYEVRTTITYSRFNESIPIEIPN